MRKMDLNPDRKSYSKNGYSYHCTFAPARISARAGFKIASVLVPVLGGLSKLKGQQGAFVAALVYLFQSPKLEDISVSLMDAFAPYTEVVVEGASPPVSYTLSTKFDEHFAGSLDEMMDWLGFVLEQNCASFLGGLLAKRDELEKALGMLEEQTNSTSQSDVAKTPSSGDSP